MSYRIAQDFEYVGKDYWRWNAWIEGDDAELDKVKEVIWILHPSFKQTRFVAKDRANKFRLTTAGWGTFLLKAEVMLGDGQITRLKHNLQLEYPESAEPSGRSTVSSSINRVPTVFLSYSAEDARVVAKLRAGLEDTGFKVLDQTQLRPGEPWNDALRRMITQSDGVIGFIGEGEIGPWVSAEIQAAAASAKPTLVFVAPGASTAGLPSETHMRKIDLNSLDPKAIAAELGSIRKY